MLSRIDSRELSERMALERINPRGEDRADLRMAMICRELHHTGFAGSSRATLAAFLPEFGRERRQSLDQQKAAWMAWVATCGGTITQR
jgi:hypothetical protein